jgi:hypothetical protein
LKEWAKTQIVEGTQQDWKIAGRNTNLVDYISDTNLILDSTDFKLQAKGRIFCKGELLCFSLLTSREGLESLMVLLMPKCLMEII